MVEERTRDRNKLVPSPTYSFVHGRALVQGQNVTRLGRLFVMENCFQSVEHLPVPEERKKKTHWIRTDIPRARLSSGFYIFSISNRWKHFSREISTVSCQRLPSYLFDFFFKSLLSN